MGVEHAALSVMRQCGLENKLAELDLNRLNRLYRLYRASDALYKHREALQDHLFAKAKSILGFGETVTLPAGDAGRAGRQRLPAPQPRVCWQRQ